MMECWNVAREWKYVLRSGRTAIIRYAEARDAEQMLRAFCSVVEEKEWLPVIRVNSIVSDWTAWIERTQNTRDVILVAEVDTVYAGHLSLQPEEWQASQHVARLGVIVKAPFRGIGLGRSLIQTAEEVAVNKGYRKIVLSTFATNIAARNLYESQGYRVVGIRYNQFLMPKGFIDEVLYEKELVPAVRQ